MSGGDDQFVGRVATLLELTTNLDLSEEKKESCEIPAATAWQ